MTFFQRPFGILAFNLKKLQIDFSFGLKIFWNQGHYFGSKTKILLQKNLQELSSRLLSGVLDTLSCYLYEYIGLWK